MSLRINEIFAAIQGEGGRAGEYSVFIRLADCNLKCSYCDTNHTQANISLYMDELAAEIAKYKTRWIIWTGGEPTLQLSDEIVEYYKALGYKQAIETNGTSKVPRGLDYIACSPKVGALELNQNFDKLDEIRWPVATRTSIPAIDELPKAAHYFLSPIFNGEDRTQMSRQNLNKCLHTISREPRWKLSIQIHKLLKIK